MNTMQGIEFAQLHAREAAGDRNLVAGAMTSEVTLETPTATVRVRDVFWREPTELIYTLTRPVIGLLVAVSAEAVESGCPKSGETILARKGCVVLLPPDQEMRSRCTAGRLRIVSCAFERTYAKRVAGSRSGLSHLRFGTYSDAESRLLPSILQRLMSEALRPGPLSTAIVESLGHAMLVEWSHLSLAQQEEPMRGARLTRRHFEIIDEYLTSLSCAVPSVADIASACGFSERYFSKLFRRQTKQSVGQYLRSAHMTKAKAYLIETELPLKEIAYRLGFSSAANFCNAFRAVTGDTPGHFRSHSPQMRELSVSR